MLGRELWYHRCQLGHAYQVSRISWAYLFFTLNLFLKQKCQAGGQPLQGRQFYQTSSADPRHCLCPVSQDPRLVCALLGSAVPALCWGLPCADSPALCNCRAPGKCCLSPLNVSISCGLHMQRKLNAKFITCAQKKVHSRSDSHGWAVPFVHSYYTVYRIICFPKMTGPWTNIEYRGSATIHWTNGAIASFLTESLDLRELWSPSCQGLAQQAVQAVSPLEWLGTAAWPACMRRGNQSPRGASAKAVAVKSHGLKSKAGEKDLGWEDMLS